MAGTGFDFKKLLDESKQTLLSPKEYFTGMAKTGGLIEPIIKAVVYGLAAGIISFLLGLLRLSPVMGMGMFGAGVGIGALIMTPVFAIIGLFIGAVIMLIISAICGGSTEFEVNTRVTAALLVLMPVNAVLQLFSRFSFYLGLVIGIALSLYGLWLIYLALCNALSAKQNVAKIVIIVLAALSIILSISSIAAYRSMSYMGGKMMQKLEANTEEAKAAQQKVEKLMQEWKKKMEEAQKGQKK
ncbi:MAG: Yip1 family protein [bacterium]|nr:Yip1 family protein [bacterium]